MISNEKLIPAGKRGTAMTKLFGVYWIVSFAVVSTVALLLIAVTPGVSRCRQIAHSGSRVLFRLTGMAPRTIDAENLPAGRCVVVANHASYLDGIILTAALPPRFAFVIKKEITRVPFVHFFLKRIGSHFVERADPYRGAADARPILRSALGNDSLGFFPEGTFQRTPGLRRFRRGAFAIAARAHLTVVPIVIHGSRNILPDGCVLPSPGDIRVTILAPLDSTGLDADRLAARARERMLGALGEPDLC